MTRLTLLSLQDPGTPVTVPPGKLLSGDGRQAVANAYSDAGGEFHAGTWSAEPCTWRVDYTEHEYCEILEGRIRMTHEDGTVSEVGPGDRFVVPAGWRGTWQVLERARKVYVMFEPRAREPA
jgi:uncharacterized cupin superfamily protein